MSFPNIHEVSAAAHELHDAALAAERNALLSWLREQGEVVAPWSTKTVASSLRRVKHGGGLVIADYEPSRPTILLPNAHILGSSVVRLCRSHTPIDVANHYAANRNEAETLHDLCVRTIESPAKRIVLHRKEPPYDNYASSSLSATSGSEIPTTSVFLMPDMPPVAIDEYRITMKRVTKHINYQGTSQLPGISPVEVLDIDSNLMQGIIQNINEPTAPEKSPNASYEILTAEACRALTAMITVSTPRLHQS